MEHTENNGQRDNLLVLGGRLTGESPGRLPPEFATAVGRSARQRPALDASALRRIAAALPDDDDVMRGVFDEPRSAGRPRRTKPANRPWRWLAPGVALAAATALFVLPDRAVPPAPTGIKGGGVTLSWAVQGPSGVDQGDGDLTLDPDERLQLQVFTADADQVTIVAIDGAGTLSHVAPEVAAEGPVDVSPGRTWIVPGAFTLDDAPGPEVFVAGVGAAAADLDARVLEAAEGGLDAVVALGDDPLIDVVVVSKP